MLPPVTRRALLRLAAPAAASGILNNAFRVIDQYAAGSIGTAAQAAIGACTFALIAFWAVTSLVAMGAGPLIARATGADDPALRRRIFGGSLTAALSIGALLGALVWLTAPLFPLALGLDPDVGRNATIFLQTLALGGPLLALAPLLDAVLVALGRTTTMMALQVGAALLNAGLNYVFIQRLGLGVEGTALATLCSRAVTGVLGVALLWRTLRPSVTDLRPDATLTRIARIGAPITLNTLFYAAVYFLLLRVAIAPLGAVTTAALGIGFSALEGITYPMFLGISLGVSSLVGRHLGAGQPEEAERAARLGLPLALGLGLGAASLFRFAAAPLCGVFTDDPEVLAAAIVYAKTLAWSQIFVSVEALAEGVLQGAGHTRPVFWLSAPMNAVRVPLAWIFAFPLGGGAAGVWWAINLTSLMKATAKGYAATRGGWKQAAP